MLRYVRSSGTTGGTGSPFLAPVGVDIMIAAGQSNATGFGSSIEENTIDPIIDWDNGRIFQWSVDGGDNVVLRNVAGHVLDTNGDPYDPEADPLIPVAYDTIDHTLYGNRLLPASEPLRWTGDTINWSIGFGPSPIMRFARNMLFFTPSDRIIVILPTAIPGSGLVTSKWDPVTGEAFAQTVAAANACVAFFEARGVDARVRYIYFGQGENSAQNILVAPSVYQITFDAALTGFRTQITNADEAILLVPQMVPNWIEADPGDEQRAAIDEIHRLAPSRLSHCWFLHGPRDSFKSDVIHYDADGCRTLGDRAFDKAIPAVAYREGVNFTVPTDLTVFGSRVSWTVPTSDAPLFAVDYRDAGSSDEWETIIYSPPHYYVAGDTVSYTFTDLTGDIEVRVAAAAYTATGPYCEPVTIEWQTIATPLVTLDVEDATVTGIDIDSVPSTGTDTTAWTSPADKEPTLSTWRGRPVMATEVLDSLLSSTVSIPAGSYTIEVLVNHLDFTGAGVYLTATEGFTDFLLWREAALSNTAEGGHNGDGAAVVGPAMTANRFHVITETYDAAAASDQLKIYLDGVLADSATVAARSVKTGMVINAVSTAGTAGNHALYADVRVWSSALDDDHIAQAAMIALDGWV
jgi:hypothetical protein